MVDINAPLSDREPTEAEADEYLEVLKDATINVQMYFPQASADSGLAVFQDLGKRNTSRYLSLNVETANTAIETESGRLS